MSLEFTDVTLRDGLQMERVLSTAQKMALLEKLGRCGYQRLEITSFVHPTKMPQFADAEAFCNLIFKKQAPPVPVMAFVPNEKGLERCLQFPIPWVACFVSVSEAFNQRNVNLSIDQSLDQVKRIVARAHEADRKVRVYISTVYGCPYQGSIDPRTLNRVFQEVAGAHPDEIALGDTIGVASSGQVQEVLHRLFEYYPASRLACHFHNTYGLAALAVRTAYHLGVRKFDGATGGVGGCPYAKGASGNVASEDLLYTLKRDGVNCSFQPKGIQETLAELDALGLKLEGNLARIWKKGGEWYGV